MDVTVDIVRGQFCSSRERRPVVRRVRFASPRGADSLRARRATSHLVRGCAIAGLVLMASTVDLHGQVMPYIDEGAFVRALSERGLVAVSESFEDDAAWGVARSTIGGGTHAVPSVASSGITWSSTSPNNAITTSTGAALTGEWGVYSSPHGDYENDIGDGVGGVGDTSLVAIGGWIDTNTPFGKISLFLDGDETLDADFGDDDVIGAGSRFFGVIYEAGFSRFDFRELEGVAEDQKFVFADDFTFAFGGTVRDCNGNGIADPQDITAGRSSDCNGNFVPDECEIDASSTAPGGPFFCVVDCDPDCNENGVLDVCEVLTGRDFDSGELSPIGHDSPQSFSIVSPPLARADVMLSFAAHANLGGNPDNIAVDIDGEYVGTIFGPDGSDCPEGASDTATIVVPQGVFNDAAATGEVTIQMVASAEVAADECDSPSFISVRVTVLVASELDADENGVPDECEGGERTPFIRGECNGDESVDISDAVCALVWLFGGGAEPGCVAATNVNGDENVDVSDVVFLLNALFVGGPPPVAPHPGCGTSALPADEVLGCQTPTNGCL